LDAARLAGGGASTKLCRRTRNRGYATPALALTLPDARKEGLPYVEITTDVTNIASQRVIEANGGVIVERFFKPAGYGAAESLRYRNALDH
jgi:predicted acetyltransferase